MFAEMKTACLLQNATQKNAAALTAQTALEMATINGARAIGREDDLGSLVAGKLADIVLIDVRRPNTYPVHDVLSNLVFATNSTNVHSVFIGGRRVLENGRVVGMDESALLARAQERAEIVRSKLGFVTSNTWQTK